jgi:hypothetical protein
VLELRSAIFRRHPELRFQTTRAFTQESGCKPGSPRASGGPPIGRFDREATIISQEWTRCQRKRGEVV